MLAEILLAGFPFMVVTCHVPTNDSTEQRKVLAALSGRPRRPQRPAGPLAPGDGRPQCPHRPGGEDLCCSALFASLLIN